MVPGADPEIGHGGGLNFGRFFRIETTKLCTHKTPKNGTNFTLLAQNSRFFGKVAKKREKIARFSRASCKMLQFCKFAPEAQENFAIFSLNYGHIAI